MIVCLLSLTLILIFVDRAISLVRLEISVACRYFLSFTIVPLDYVVFSPLTRLCLSSLCPNDEFLYICYLGSEASRALHLYWFRRFNRDHSVALMVVHLCDCFFLICYTGYHLWVTFS